MRIEVQQLIKRYAGVVAVNQLSFEVDAGEIFAMLGPNGAGKSSTIRMLIGLTQPDDGEMGFHTQQGVQPTLQGAQFGYLPEERGLFQDKSLIATLQYFGQLKGMSKADVAKQAEYWLTEFELWQRKDELLKSLSKGNQQKVQLITAILHQPQLLILDEPFSGLDPLNQEKVIDFLQLLKSKGMTIILSAHQMSLVEKLADRFLLMDQGSALLYGTMSDIRQKVNLGEQLLLDFVDSTDCSTLSKLPGVSDCEQISPVQIRLSLKAGMELPDLLQTIFTQHEVSSLKTEPVDLHSIYLHSLGNRESIK